jgi:hypothetical protein
MVLLFSLVACGGRSGLVGGNGSDGGVSPGSSGTVGSWDGGLLSVPAPGNVRCGGDTCGPADHCCVTTGGVPASNGCASRYATLCNGTQVVRDCDQSADCHPDEVCCLEAVSGLSVGAYCTQRDATTGGCPTGMYVGCASDADCTALAAPACVAQACGADVLQTCGLMPSEWCPPL